MTRRGPADLPSGPGKLDVKPAGRLPRAAACRSSAGRRWRRRRPACRPGRSARLSSCTSRELIATGEKVPKRSAEAHDRLTPQEEQIARLARDGRTSAQIGTQLFLSARTVEWHLGKGVHQAGHRLPPRTARRAGPARTGRPGGLAKRLSNRWPARPVPSPATCPGAAADATAPGGIPAGRVRSRRRPRGP